MTFALQGTGMRLIYVALMLLAGSTAAAAQSATPSLVDRNSQIVASSPAATDAFKVEPDGKIRHLQSGALCPAGFENVVFVHALIFPAPAAGLDVGCDYGRAGPEGRLVAKLTIFFVKVPQNATLDSIFAQYRQEIAMAHPGAKEAPSSIKITDKASNQPRTDYRSSSYKFSLGETPYNSELIVGIFNGWILKIRATSPANLVIRDDGDKNDLRTAVFDEQSPYMAFMSAQASLSKSDPPH
jgi:hypothetical protein